MKGKLSAGYTLLFAAAGLAVVYYLVKRGGSQTPAAGSTLANQESLVLPSLQLISNVGIDPYGPALTVQPAALQLTAQTL